MLNITPEEELIQEQQEIERAAALERARIEQYESIFQQTHPKPPPPVLETYEMPEFKKEPFPKEGTGFFERFGVEAMVNALATVGGIVFSAVRTAGIFAIAEAALLKTYNINTSLQNTLSVVASFSVIAIVEGVLAGFGWIRGKQSGKVNTSWTPIIIAGLISALAGILPAYELIPEFAWKDNIYLGLIILLTFLSGPGIAYLLVVVTENFGHLHNAWVAMIKEEKDKWDDEQNQNKREFEESQSGIKAEVDAHNREMLETYKESLTTYHEALETDFRQKGRPLLFGEDKFVVRRNSSSSSENKTQKADTSIQPKVQEWLTTNNISPHMVGTKEGDVMSPADLTVAIDQVYNLGLVEYNEDGSVKKANSAPVRKALERLRKTMS